MARMKVDERNRQPFGFLSGGASLAFWRWLRMWQELHRRPSVLIVPVWALRLAAVM